MRVLVIILLLISCDLKAQDTTSVLDYEGFIERVKEHHPMAFRSMLVTQTGEANLLRSRGGFDPQLKGSIDQKYFADKQYYSYMNGALKVPTWFGLSAEAGYDRNQGDFVNALDRVPDAGLWYAGLRLELGNGLIIDERRAQLKQAKIYLEASRIEQKQMLNDLLLSATEAYWKWVAAYNKRKVYEEAMQNAKFRFEGVKRSAKLGDRPDIDTVETWIQWQNRVIGYQETSLQYLNAREYLELFLWDYGYVPLEINGSIPPEQSGLRFSSPTENDRLYLDSASLNHPLLDLGQFKIDQATIDLRYKKEQLKPKLTVKYNAIAEPIGGNPLTEYNLNNYKWGGAIAYPILTRKERGEVRLSKIKLQDQELGLKSKSVEIDYKVRSAYNTWTTSNLQRETFDAVVKNYQTLYEAELKLFSIGESSVFMVNSREKAMIDSQLKIIDLIYKAKVSEAQFRYSLLQLDQ